MGPMDTMVRYAESNGFVILRPVIQNPNNASASHTNANEIARGCWDGTFVECCLCGLSFCL